jgi:hypothetical protein
MTEVLFNTQEEAILFDISEPPEVVELKDALRDIWSSKKELRIKYCGYQQTRENPKTGRIYIDVHLCNEPACKYCGPRIREEMRLCLEKHLEDTSLRKVVLEGSSEEQKRQRAHLMRKYSKEKASVFVSESFSEEEEEWIIQTELLIKTEDEIGEPLSEIKTEDLERWSSKAFNQKKSGYLHLSEKPQPVIKREEEDLMDDLKDPSSRIEIEKWLLSTKDKELLFKIEKEVLQETSLLLPQQPDDLDYCLSLRRELRKAKYKEKEIVILDVETSYITVRTSQIDWSLPPSKAPPD